MLCQLSAEDDVKNPEDFAHKWQIVLMGSIVAAVDGDLDAARRARGVAVYLLEREAPAGL